MGGALQQVKIKHFYEPMLGVNCYFIYEYTPEEALKGLRKLDAICKDEVWESFHFEENNNGKTIKYIKDDIPRYLVFVKGRWYHVLVHEAVHLTNMIFDQKGIRLDIDNDEYYAYYIEYWYSLWEHVLNNK